MKTLTEKRPFRLTAPPSAQESDTQTAILTYLRIEMSRNGRVLRVERRNSGVIRRYDGGYGAPAYRLWLQGEPEYLEKGVEDIIGVLKDGRFFGIEVKSKEGTLTTEQSKVAKLARRTGLLHLVARDVDEVRAWLDEILPRIAK